MPTGSRWIIVSNRLPFTKDPNTGNITPSSGGLVSAISGIKGGHRKIWIGSVGTDIDTHEFSTVLKDDFEEFLPVRISDSDYESYYNHISNDVLWPLFHYEAHLVHFEWKDWKIYKKINTAFAKKILQTAKKGDLIWIHDFHLLLLAKMLRDVNKDLKIGFFLHIPFPSSEIFKQLPVAKELLLGLLGADLIGFHEHSYLMHFRSSLQAILGVSSTLFSTVYEQREIHLGVFPVSIDTEKFLEKKDAPEIKKIYKKLNASKDHDILILGVDRLDYTKGVDLKLRAFREVLRRRSNSETRISLLQVAVPTRREIPIYISLKEEVERLVGEINGEFGSPTHIPVNYLYKSISFEELLVLYRRADILLVSSKRDGMNLVTLEYIASQNIKNPGTVILSKFAGAASMLPHIIVTNPWDITGTAQDIEEALSLTPKQKIGRHRPMLQYLKNYTSTHWAERFMKSLDSVKVDSDKKVRIISFSGKKITLPQELESALVKQEIVIFLDYDGTMVAIANEPNKAIFSEELKKRFLRVNRNKNIKIIIISGRDKNFLSTQFKDIPVDLVAEHGALFFSQDTDKWEIHVQSNVKEWYDMSLQIMKSYTDYVPESFIEKKKYSIAWHYRQSPQEFASYQANKLHQELDIGLANLPVTVIEGKKLIEVRCVEANKGMFVRWFLLNRLASENVQTIAIGDDFTDEEMFKAISPKGISVKVGNLPTTANYLLESQEGVFPLLERVDKLVLGK